MTPMLARSATAGQATFEPDDDEDERSDDDRPPEPDEDERSDDDRPPEPDEDEPESEEPEEPDPDDPDPEPGPEELDDEFPSADLAAFLSPLSPDDDPESEPELVSELPESDVPFGDEPLSEPFSALVLTSGRLRLSVR